MQEENSAPKKNPRTPQRDIPKKTFMHHDPVDKHSLGKYSSRSFRQAALKVATKVGEGSNKVILRQTGTKHCKVFACGVKVLDNPNIVVRDGKEIKYRKISWARLESTYDMDGWTEGDGGGDASGQEEVQSVAAAD